MRGRPPKPPKDRFLSKVAIPDDPDACWEWLASKKRGGYGQFGLVNGKMVGTNRYAYELFRGPVPEDLQVLHTCDNPGCVNPRHLFLGTGLDNMQDRDRKGRHVPCPGEKHGQHKLTEAQVREIRSRYVPRVVTLKMLAAEYDVCESEISQLVRRKIWTHLP